MISKEFLDNMYLNKHQVQQEVRAYETGERSDCLGGDCLSMEDKEYFERHNAALRRRDFIDGMINDYQRTHQQPGDVDQAMNKEQFCQKYVLMRARACGGSMSGSGAAEEAMNAWNKLQRGKE